MHKSCLSLLIVFLILVPAFTQTQGTRPTQSSCSLVAAPPISGFKLGMPAEDVLALLPEGNESQINKRAVVLAERPPNFRSVPMCGTLC